ncbi:hypothetical protein CIB48_g183 [Xylaria polymorpha]|nr:hypothetical protein CIB48_g183 [Xylaria polymorpha]
MVRLRHGRIGKAAMENSVRHINSHSGLSAFLDRSDIGGSPSFSETLWRSELPSYVLHIVLDSSHSVSIFLGDVMEVRVAVMRLIHRARLLPFPTEYIEDVEMFAAWAGEDNGERETLRVRSLFRKESKGEAKDWYLNLGSDKRKDWDKMKDSFEQRFLLKGFKADPGLVLRIDNLKRRPEETLAKFVRRATDLSYRASDTQLTKLQARLFKYMCTRGLEEDRRIQEKVSDRLLAKTFIDDLAYLPQHERD